MFVLRHELRRTTLPNLPPQRRHIQQQRQRRQKLLPAPSKGRVGVVNPAFIPEENTVAWDVTFISFLPFLVHLFLAAEVELNGPRLVVHRGVEVVVEI